MPEHFFHSSFCKPLLVPVAIKMGSTRVGGLVEIAAACMWLWQSQSGMNLEFPPAPIPAGPMPDIASLRPWQILPPGSRPRITLAADAIPNPQWDRNLAMDIAGD